MVSVGANCTTNQPTSQLSAVLARFKVTKVGDRAIVTEQTPATSSAA